MARQRISWTTTTDPDIYNKFQAFVNVSRIPKSRLLDEALEDLLLKYKVIDKKEKTP